ncbi:MAG: sulfatase [Candidatus Hydrogenedentota bacterium]
MNRRSFLEYLALGAAACAMPQTGCAQTVTTPRPPNIVLIMADDLGYGDLACYGNEDIATPHIDALAAEGMRFTDYHANAPVCSPTRAALLTGCYPRRFRIDSAFTARRGRDKGLHLSAHTISESLHPKGYETALFGKWHLGYKSKFNPVHQGFDRFRGFVSGNVDFFSHIDQEGYEDWWRQDEKRDEDGYVTDLITRHAVSFIEENRAKPFFLYLPHQAVHYPYQGPDGKPLRTTEKVGPVQGGRGLKFRRQAYAAMLRRLDHSVGKVMAALREHGLEKDTFVFFCSDNGALPVGNNGPLRGIKATVWEGGIRVPAIAWWPGRIPAGVTTEATAMSMDLFPTVHEFTGVPMPEGHTIDGVSLAKLLTGKEPLPERTLFWRFRRQAAVRQGSWKLVLMPPAKGKRGKDVGEDTPPEKDAHLFHLGNDPGEEHDLSAEHPERVAAMRSALETWEARMEAAQQAAVT